MSTQSSQSATGEGRARTLGQPRGRLWGSIVDAVFPPRCIGCGSSVVRSGGFLCSMCEAEVVRLGDDVVCPTCAADVGRYASGDGYCRECRTGPRSPRATVRAGSYTSICGAMLRDYKYRGRQEVGPVLLRLLGEAVGRAPWADQIDAVVPVPTHWRRRLSQRIDVVDALSESVARSLGLPAVRGLRRVRFNGSQVGLSYTARQQNVRGAFEIARGIRLNGPTLLLVDDVRTTGATLGECARTLKRAGAKEVFAAVVARVCYSDKREVADLPA